MVHGSRLIGENVSLFLTDLTAPGRNRELHRI
jgi:hypothetical protein